MCGTLESWIDVDIERDGGLWHRGPIEKLPVDLPLTKGKFAGFCSETSKHVNLIGLERTPSRTLNRPRASKQPCLAWLAFTPS